MRVLTNHILLMNKKTIKYTALTVAMACTTMGFTSCSGMSDRSLVKVQAISTGAAVGALGGAALGAGISAIAGGNSKKNLQAAAIGAGIGLLAGAIAGNSWGDRVIKKKEEFASMEEYYKQHIDLMNDRTKQVNDVIADLDKSIAKQEAITAATYAKTKKDVDDLLRRTENEIAAARAENNPVVNASADTLSAQRELLVQRMTELEALAIKA